MYNFYPVSGAATCKEQRWRWPCPTLAASCGQATRSFSFSLSVILLKIYSCQVREWFTIVSTGFVHISNARAARACRSDGGWADLSHPLPGAGGPRQVQPLPSTPDAHQKCIFYPTPGKLSCRHVFLDVAFVLFLNSLEDFSTAFMFLLPQLCHHFILTRKGLVISLSKHRLTQQNLFKGIVLRNLGCQIKPILFTIISFGNLKNQYKAFSVFCLPLWPPLRPPLPYPGRAESINFTVRVLRGDFTIPVQETKYACILLK